MPDEDIVCIPQEPFKRKLLLVKHNLFEREGALDSLRGQKFNCTRLAAEDLPGIKAGMQLKASNFRITF